ncbi:translation initiation factor eIF-1A protein [Marine Group I thaumarchaeote SCGC AAA799-N04]|uniref:Translation initiation factor eIF-1A protein n=1 Tax=Marine Group I thaumarchaeote SCGC AAA799-N04 TaxID=1502293 RepID=A0A081RMV9_9ARCH|nr:translation initiation factor eIF-1A protein [Marine Group I thaumarchaeote SCGC AAA799-N04]
MGKRQVKNEKALKEIRLPETDEEMFGRVIKMMGGENLMVKCADKKRKNKRQIKEKSLD